MKTNIIRKKQSSVAIGHRKGLLYHFSKTAKKALSCSAICLALCAPSLGFWGMTQPHSPMLVEASAIQDINHSQWSNKQAPFDEFSATTGVNSGASQTILLGASSPTNLNELLRQPKQIEIGEDFVILYDSYIKRLNLYSHTGTAEELVFVCSSQPLDILDMQLSDGRLFVLHQSGTTKTLSEVNTETLETTDFSFTASFNLTSSVFAINENCSAVYFYNENHSVQRFSISSSTLDHEQDYTINILSENEQIKKLRLDETESLFYLLSSENKIYSTETFFPYETEALVEWTESTIYDFTLTQTTPSEIIFTTSDNKIVIHGANGRTISSATSINHNGLAIKDNYVLTTDSKNRTIQRTDLTSEATTIILKNVLADPVLVDAEDTIQTTLIETTPYFSSIDEVEPSGTIPADTHILIISDINNFTTHNYIFFTNNGTNMYAYIKSDASHTTFNENDITETRRIIGDGNKLYSYPSKVQDENNQILDTLAPMQEVIRINSQDFTNADGSTFSLVRLESGLTGYVETKTLATVSNPLNEKIKCDARTVRATTIYATARGTDEIITIRKNTRIKIAEEFNKRDEYVKIIYQLADGTTITGYAKTRDIKTDSLSTLQILGIGLIAVNIIFIFVLLASFKKIRNQRTSVRPQEEQGQDD